MQKLNLYPNALHGNSTTDKSFYDYLLNNGTLFGVAVKTYAEYLLDTAKKGRNKNEL